MATRERRRRLRTNTFKPTCRPSCPDCAAPTSARIEPTSMGEFLDTTYRALTGQLILPFYEGGLRRRGTFRYRAEFERNQWKPAEEISALQWDRLKALLKHSCSTVPYYRDAFQAAGLTPENISSPSDFARLPLLEKQTVRENRDRLMSTSF